MLGNWQSESSRSFAASGQPHSNLLYFVPTPAPDPDMQNLGGHFKYRYTVQCRGSGISSLSTLASSSRHLYNSSPWTRVFVSPTQLLNASLRGAWRHQSGSCSALHICILHNTTPFNPLKPELNPICYLLALLAHHFLHVSRIRVKSLTLRWLMSYIYI